MTRRTSGCWKRSYEIHTWLNKGPAVKKIHKNDHCNFSFTFFVTEKKRFSAIQQCKKQAPPIYLHFSAYFRILQCRTPYGVEGSQLITTKACSGPDPPEHMSYTLRYNPVFFWGDRNFSPAGAIFFVT